MILEALQTDLPPDLSKFTGVRYLVISDVHLGNARNPAWRIILNMREYFCHFEEEAFVAKFGRLDILFIDGDFFDKSLFFSSDDIVAITSFVVDLFAFAERIQMRVRYIEGTPSHDRNQFRNFVPVARNFANLDFRYVEEMGVEYFSDLGITCLYVPDEHAGGGEKSQALIDQLLKDLKIDKVSIAMVHSWYKYQVPEVSSSTKYDEQFFLDRVIYYISNGHIHIPSTFERIVNQGSFDRVAHGEEHPKGAVLFDIKPDVQYFFPIENKNALPFRTLHFKNKDLDGALEQIDKVAPELPEYSWIRLKAKEMHPILGSLDLLNQKYPHVRFEKITEEEESRSLKQLVDQQTFDNVSYEAPRLDPTTIVDQIMQAMMDNKFTNHDLPRLRSHLEGLV